MRVLIAGCGYVGSALAETLANKGHEVFGLKRKPEGLPPKVHPVAADLTAPESLTQLPEVDAIVYAASPGRSGKSGYKAIYVDGLTNLIDAYAGREPKRLVFVSSTGVYGQDDGGWVDEISPTDPKRSTGRTLLEAEGIANSAKCETIVLRLGGIYGPGRTRTIDSVRDGTAELPEGSPQYLNHIHRDDCVGAIAYLLEIDSPAHLYLGVDDAPEDRAVMLDWIAARLGVDPPKRVPAEEASIGRGGNKRCINRLLKASGYQFKYPSYREGYAALIDSSSGK